MDNSIDLHLSLDRQPGAVLRDVTDGANNDGVPPDWVANDRLLARLHFYTERGELLVPSDLAGNQIIFQLRESAAGGEVLFEQSDWTFEEDDTDAAATSATIQFEPTAVEQAPQIHDGDFIRVQTATGTHTFEAYVNGDSTSVAEGHIGFTAALTRPFAMELSNEVGGCGCGGSVDLPEAVIRILTIQNPPAGTAWNATLVRVPRSTFGIDNHSVWSVNSLWRLAPLEPNTAQLTREYPLRAPNGGIPGDGTAAFADDTIYFAAHGLEAGEEVIFFYPEQVDEHIEGQSGAWFSPERSQRYYVIADGLTTDTFKISDEEGGAAIELGYDVDTLAGYEPPLSDIIGLHFHVYRGQDDGEVTIEPLWPDEDIYSLTPVNAPHRKWSEAFAAAVNAAGIGLSAEALVSISAEFGTPLEWVRVRLTQADTGTAGNGRELTVEAGERITLVSEFEGGIDGAFWAEGEIDLETGGAFAEYLGTTETRPVTVAILIEDGSARRTVARFAATAVRDDASDAPPDSLPHTLLGRKPFVGPSGDSLAGVRGQIYCANGSLWLCVADRQWAHLTLSTNFQTGNPA